MRCVSGFLIIAMVLFGVSCSEDPTCPGDPEPPADLPYGNGHHGSLTVTGTHVLSTGGFVVAGMAGSDTLQTKSPPLLAFGQRIFLHQTRGAGAGAYEIATVVDVGMPDIHGDCEIILHEPLANGYLTGGNDRAQAQVVAELTDLTIEAGGLLRAPAWNGETGGLLVLRVSGTATVEAGGVITMDRYGYRGGPGQYGLGIQGEGHPSGGGNSQASNGNGGGGAYWNPIQGYPGAGGGHGSGGGNSTGSYTAYGGQVCGGDLATQLFFGGGGGGGTASYSGVSDGGDGGGVIFLAAAALQVSGSIRCSGYGGVDGGEGGGGGGAGGSILLISDSCALGEELVTAPGGAGIGGSGAGGEGRIAVRSPEVTGSTLPPYTTIP